MTSKNTEMNEVQRNEVFLQSQTVRETTFRKWLEGKDIEAPDVGFLKEVHSQVMTNQSDINELKNHNHNNVYASKNHMHDEYAIRTHTHEEYANSRHTHEEYANKAHEHDDTYASKTHNHNDTYADKQHTHGEYADKVHAHGDYANRDHNHNEQYATKAHTHGEYALATTVANNIQATKNELNTSLNNRANSLQQQIDIVNQDIGTINEGVEAISQDIETIGERIETINGELPTFLPLAGGVVAGDLTCGQYFKISAMDGHGSGEAKLWFDATNPNGRVLHMANIDKIKLTSGEDVYTTENKPTPNDIGALPATMPTYKGNMVAVASDESYKWVYHVNATQGTLNFAPIKPDGTTDWSNQFYITRDGRGMCRDNKCVAVFDSDNPAHYQIRYGQGLSGKEGTITFTW